MKSIAGITLHIRSRIDDLNWQGIYEASLPRIFHFFCYKVGDPQLAEELTAITFEKAWSTRRNYRKDLGEVHAWLLGIARHVAGDHFRKPLREVALDYLSAAPVEVSMEEDLQHRWDFQKVSRILERIPARERELIALKYGAGLTNREIAKMTGLSESNVGTILHRVVGRIRTEWEQDDE